MQSPMLETLLATQEERLGAINWVSMGFVKVVSYGIYFGDRTKISVTTASAHGLTQGDEVFILGIGPKLDGKATVITHPHRDVDKTKTFLIEANKEAQKLEEIITGVGSLHRAKKWSVRHPERLSMTPTTELKRLSYEKAQWIDSAMPYLQINAEQEAVTQGIATLSKKAKIRTLETYKPDLPESDTPLSEVQKAEAIADAREDAFNERIKRIPSETRQKTAFVKSIIEDFGITYKGFAKDINSLIHQASKLGEGLDIDPEKISEAMDKKPIELKKRRVEILCEMPAGHMSALDNLGGINAFIDGIANYIESLLPGKKPTHEREGEKKSEPAQ